jgi:hypothetical protein
MTATKTRSKSRKTAGEVQNPTVYIVGFAPSWTETPWDDGGERWGMNALHKLAPDKPFDRWYQLHDIDEHHKDDRDEHVGWLRGSKLPIVMWPEHVEKYGDEIPNAVPYPKAEVIEKFGKYFTNTVSWMIAHALYEGRENIGVFGVDMAQDSEYGHQRPSCEYFVGWARGMGVNVHIPDTSDLLKAPFLYGVEDGGQLRAKMVNRQKELMERKANLEAQGNQVQAALHQVLGALEDTQYWLRAWTLEGIGGDGNGPT